MKAESAIILLNWNGWRDTIECLESLIQLNHPSYAVIVVDNSSTDDSLHHINKWLANQNPPKGFAPLAIQQFLKQDQINTNIEPLGHRSVTLIEANENGGFAAGNNLGLQLALNTQCTYMWLLNNDTIVDSDALAALERHIQHNPKSGMVGSILCYYDQPDTIQAVGGVQFNFWRSRGIQVGQGLSMRTANLKSLASEPLSYIAGASMLVSKEFLADVGLMYEKYFLYFEEIDWAARAQPNWSLATAQDSFVYHKEGGSIGTSSRATRSRLAQYYLTRNCVIFYWLRKPYLIPLVIANSLYEITKHALARRWQLALCTLQALARAACGEVGKGKFR